LIHGRRNQQPIALLAHARGSGRLQYEEVAGELQRNAAPAIQVLQDFGIMKLDDILHVEATGLHGVVS